MLRPIDVPALREAAAPQEVPRNARVSSGSPDHPRLDPASGAPRAHNLAEAPVHDSHDPPRVSRNVFVVGDHEERESLRREAVKERQEQLRVDGVEVAVRDADRGVVAVAANQAVAELVQRLL